MVVEGETTMTTIEIISHPLEVLELTEEQIKDAKERLNAISTTESEPLHWMERD